MTIKDIAKKSGYAVSTVSRALNNHPDVSEEAKKKIQEVVEEYKFIPNSNAKRLKQQDLQGIAVIVKGTSNMLFSEIVEKMQAYIKETSYLSILRYIDEDDDEVRAAVRICNEWKPLGIIFLGGNRENFIKSFSHISIPCVVVTNEFEDLGYENLSSVATDDSEASKSAINMLIENGHRKIGIIGGNTKISSTSQQRLQGVRESFIINDLPFNPDKQFQKARYSYQSAYAAVEKLLNKNSRLTAIFTMSDVMAIGTVRALLDRGIRVPEDISVIGFDGIKLGQFFNPKLTSIRQSAEKLAERGVSILIDCIENGSEAVHEIVPFDISEGESIKNIKKGGE